MTQLEQRLGYAFKERALLLCALTHKSYAHERAPGQSNERMEFLGDSALGFLTARFLYEQYPDLPEGELTRRRALLVCENSLAALARGLELGDHLRLGQGELRSRGQLRDSILSDAFEAVLGAILLDGGIASAEALLRRLLLREELDFSAFEGDAKTALQERVQRKPGRTLLYRVVSEEGPDHAKRYTVEALLDGTPVGRGMGGTKKKAEQDAARAALENQGLD